MVDLTAALAVAALRESILQACQPSSQVNLVVRAGGNVWRKAGARVLWGMDA